MCINPSMPPKSTKAPKLVNLCTTPSIIASSSKLFHNFSLLASSSSFSTSFLDRITLLFCLSKSNNITSNSCPINCSKFVTKFADEWDAGIKPLIPFTKAINPPLLQP